MKQVAIVDYGLGNLFNVQRAFEAVGAQATITSKAADLEAAESIVLPGVGAFGEGMQNLDRLGLSPVIQRLAREGVPTLGLCLGMQLLMDQSEEFGQWEGLGLIPGRVLRIEPLPGASIKVPQIGWNSLSK